MTRLLSAIRRILVERNYAYLLNFLMDIIRRHLIPSLSLQFSLLTVYKTVYNYSKSLVARAVTIPVFLFFLFFLFFSLR